MGSFMLGIACCNLMTVFNLKLLVIYSNTIRFNTNLFNVHICVYVYASCMFICFSVLLVIKI